MTRITFAALVAGLSLLTAAPALAAAVCTLVVEADSGRVLHRSGAQCDTRNSPASTFKIPLAVIGFETGVLTSPTTPVWPYRADYNAAREAWRADINPTAWLRESVVWYSQVLTRELGMRRFQTMVDALGYGDRDLSGDPGKDNGLTHAWLSSSLRISPAEEVAFLRRLIRRQLPVSRRAMDLTVETMPRFTGAGGWAVTGKTGAGSQRGAKGLAEANKPFGWFVGWAQKDGRRVVFARLVKFDARTDTPASYIARDTLLADLPSLTGPDR